MKTFDKIIKQKIEQFEVPFNDTHWSEMETRLNKVSSKQNKKLFFGSAATVITLVIAAFFLFPSAPTIDLNSKEQIPVEKLSNRSNSAIDQPTVSVAKEETKSEVLRDEEISSKASPRKIISDIKKVPITPSKTIIKTNESKAQIIDAEEKETIIPETIQKEDPSILESNLDLNTIEATPIENSITVTPAKEINNIPEIKAAEPTKPYIANANRKKSERYKSYKDENVSKKNVKRRRRSFFSFFSFKKKRYKIPLSKKKPLSNSERKK